MSALQQRIWQIQNIQTHGLSTLKGRSAQLGWSRGQDESLVFLYSMIILWGRWRGNWWFNHRITVTSRRGWRTRIAWRRLHILKIQTNTICVYVCMNAHACMPTNMHIISLVFLATTMNWMCNLSFQRILYWTVH